MNTKQLTSEQANLIRESILPAADHYNRTGTLNGVTVPPMETIQQLHQQILGYRFDQGCPSCIGDAIKILGNIYREQQPEDIDQKSDHSIANKLRGKAGRFIKNPNPGPPPSNGDIQQGEEEES